MWRRELVEECASTAMPQRLVSELQALVAESRRKHPDVRQATERLLQRVHSNLDGTLAELPHDASIEHVVLLACQTRAPKVIQLAVSLLHRSVVLHVLPEASVPRVVEALQALQAPGRADIDVQLKILQTVSALLAGYPSITGTQLSGALMLCFALYEHSRVAVVSSTAAATLRQNIMIVFDKVQDEDRVFDGICTEDAAAQAPLPVHTAQTPDGPATLFPCSADAYRLFSDLCALADGEPASFLPLASLAKPFVLELLESVLTNHALLFAAGAPGARHPELVYVLRSAACPLLLKALSEPPPFPVYVRVMRLVSLLLSQFSEEVMLEMEILLRALLKTMSAAAKHALWERVLALETLRALCTDATFLRHLWFWYDARPGGEVRMLASLVDALCDETLATAPQLVIDPSLAAAREQRPETPVSPGRRVSGSLYDAASAAVRSAAENLLMTRSETLTRASFPALALLDQLDKLEPPAVGSGALPSSYVPALLLSCCIGVASQLGNVQTGAAPEEAAAEGPAPGAPAKTPSIVVQSAEAPTHPMTVAVRPLTTALGFFLSVEGDDLFFDQALLALARLAVSAGADKATAQQRDLCLSTLSDFALPSAAFSGKALGARNHACQVALAHVCVALASRLDERWRSLLQCVCQALALCAPCETADAPAATEPLELPAMQNTLGAPLVFLAPEALAALPRTLRAVLTHSATLPDSALDAMVAALCTLAADRARDTPESSALAHVLLVQTERVALCNAARIAARVPDGPWAVLERTLAAVAADDTVAAARRLSAAHALNASAFAVLRARADATAQAAVLAALAREATLGGGTAASDIAVRHAAVDTLHRVLSTSAHTLRAGWSDVFAACGAAARDATALRTATPLLPLLRAAFACVQLVCDAHLAALDDAHLAQCMACLGSFSTQAEDVAMALTANGALWDISADIARRQQYTNVSDLWLTLLHCMREIARVPHAEVRNGALANLFQVLMQYSASLHADDWRRILFEILLPLLKGTDAPPRAFQGTAQLLREQLPALQSDPAFPHVWTHFFASAEAAHAAAPPETAHTALVACARVAQGAREAPRNMDAPLLDASWTTWLRLCTARADASLADLDALMEMYEALYPQRTPSDVGAVLAALEACVRRGAALCDALSLAPLQRILVRVDRAVQQLGATAGPLALASRMRHVAAALDAVNCAAVPPRARRARIALADELLRQWRVAFAAHGDAYVYDMSVPALLTLLERPLAACPAADEPGLWHAAVDTLVEVAAHGASAQAWGEAAAPFWRAVLLASSAALTADAPTRPSDADDAAAMRLLTALERDVLPCAGRMRAADAAVSEWAYAAVGAAHAACGDAPRARECFAYAVWQMLFALCSADACRDAGVAAVARQLAPLLVDRCAALLREYAADASVRGAMPMPRVRIEEVNYVLAQLSTWHMAEAARAIDAPCAPLFALGPELDALAALPTHASTPPQRASIGSSMHGIAELTTPASLAQRCVARRTQALPAWLGRAHGPLEQ